jgi:hypothetical protein
MVSLVHRFLSPWWRRRYVPPKRRFLQEPHGVTSQKRPFFTWIVVRHVARTDLYGRIRHASSFSLKTHLQSHANSLARVSWVFRHATSRAEPSALHELCFYKCSDDCCECENFRLLMLWLWRVSTGQRCRQRERQNCSLNEQRAMKMLKKVPVEKHVFMTSAVVWGVIKISACCSCLHDHLCSWLQTQRSRCRSPALPDFLSSSGSGTGSTQPLWE